MRADTEFEARARAIIEGLLSGPVDEAVSPLEVEAAATALDAARAECQQRRMLALLRAIVRMGSEFGGGPEVSDEEFAEAVAMPLRAALEEWGTDEDAGVLAVKIAARLNQCLRTEYTALTPIGELLA
ncbi:MAG TPA: hypothetical protein VGM23_05180 [Armatimonadota bacterium]|jgi:hypothetical protein